MPSVCSTDKFCFSLFHFLIKNELSRNKKTLKNVTITSPTERFVKIGTARAPCNLKTCLYKMSKVKMVEIHPLGKYVCAFFLPQPLTKVCSTVLDLIQLKSQKGPQTLAPNTSLAVQESLMDGCLGGSVG